MVCPVLYEYAGVTLLNEVFTYSNPKTAAAVLEEMRIKVKDALINRVQNRDEGWNGYGSVRDRQIEQPVTVFGGI
jgi:hypothetical protein